MLPYQVAAVKRRMAMTAMQGISEPFSNLLPPGAMSNLTKYRALAADLLGCHLEVAWNLDQNPECMPHWGRQMPVVLASTTNMWLLKQNRPLTAKAGRSKFFFRPPVTTHDGCSLHVVVVVVHGCCRCCRRVVAVCVTLKGAPGITRGAHL